MTERPNYEKLWRTKAYEERFDGGHTDHELAYESAEADNASIQQSLRRLALFAEQRASLRRTARTEATTDSLAMMRHFRIQGAMQTDPRVGNQRKSK